MNVYLSAFIMTVGACVGFIIGATLFYAAHYALECIWRERKQ